VKTFFGEPLLAQDHMRFNAMDFYLTLDRHERIAEWNYKTDYGVDQRFEKIGQKILGLTIHQAWQACATFEAGLPVYFHLSRLLGMSATMNLQQNSHIICRCFGVSAETLERELHRSSDYSLEFVAKKTRASLGCGSCLSDVRSMVQALKDTKAIDSGVKTRPLGMNPIDFMLLLASAWEQWRKRNDIEHEMKFIGVKGYCVYIRAEVETIALERFLEYARQALKVNFNLQQV